MGKKNDGYFPQKKIRLSLSLKRKDRKDKKTPEAIRAPAGELEEESEL